MQDNNNFDNSNNKSTHGGKREGAGRKEGSISKKTKEQKIVEEEFRQRVLKSMSELINSQMSLAKGCHYLFKIETKKWKDKKGNWKEEKKKPKIVESQNIIESYLAGELDNEDNDYYFISTDKPDNRALDSLIDRVFGKAPQAIDVTSKGEKLEQVLVKFLDGKNENDRDTS